MSSQKEPDRTCSTELEHNRRCELEENLRVLQKAPVFSSIPFERLRVYAYLSKRVCYQADEFLFRQGDSDDLGYIVITGHIQLIREFEDHSVLVNDFREGDFLGGFALLSDIRRIFSARAATDVECVTLDRESFRKLVLQFPELSIKVLDIMIRRLLEMEEKLFRAEPHKCFYT